MPYGVRTIRPCIYALGERKIKELMENLLSLGVIKRARLTYHDVMEETPRSLVENAARAKELGQGRNTHAPLALIGHLASARR